MYKAQVYQNGIPIPEKVAWYSKKEAQTMKDSWELFFTIHKMDDYTCIVEFFDEDESLPVK